MEKNQWRGKKKKWTDGEVQALLSLYSTEEIQRDFDSSECNTKIFAGISSQLALLGIHHTAEQCREKINKLKQDYKILKDHYNKSGSDRKWYDALDSILGHRPAFSNKGAAKLLDFIARGTGSCSPPREGAGAEGGSLKNPLHSFLILSSYKVHIRFLIACI
uniref:Myb/SANT-like DNA-binding domain-containing protein n=1 Tax=Echeneis naucrates TaxID=173247 RepID=A0A665U2B7_ECHNA